jgi:hypothetical protein
MRVNPQHDAIEQLAESKENRGNANDGRNTDRNANETEQADNSARLNGSLVA